MYINKIVFIVLLSCVINIELLGKEKVPINFENLTITSFIQITSKILKKNILLPYKIIGDVDFISHKKVYKEDLLEILRYVLESKGYKLIEKGNILQVIKISDIKNKVKKKRISPNKIEIFHLKNVEAINVFKIISDIVGQRKYVNEFSKPSISIDEESNSIILMGIKSELKYFRDLIDILDVDKEQIYVQAKIIEISETLTRNVGIKYGLQGFNSTGSVLSTFSSSLNNGLIVDLSSLSYLGINLSSMKEALSLGMSLNLLNKNGAVDIISEPSLLCIDNKESSIYVGQTISIKTGTTTSSSGIPTDTYEREDIGLTLSVKPRISNKSKVLLKIHTKLEDVEHISSTNSNPNTSKKELITSAIVNNGESIILGGYIRAQKEIVDESIPFLREIPLLGNLFKNKYTIKDKINLVIIITPYIVPKRKGLSYIRNQLSQLKILEEKYTEEVILQLSNKNVKVTNDDESKKQLHQQRVDKILGL
ncbi:secretin N-terminal domain-containing protein [Arcobacteraceae bacterium]|nr:secretin N-terminal domain-containing protein [Arcobacteraceae bacterium]